MIFFSNSKLEAKVAALADLVAAQAKHIATLEADAVTMQDLINECQAKIGDVESEMITESAVESCVESLVTDILRNVSVSLDF